MILIIFLVIFCYFVCVKCKGSGSILIDECSSNFFIGVINNFSYISWINLIISDNIFIIKVVDFC